MAIFKIIQQNLSSPEIVHKDILCFGRALSCDKILQEDIVSLYHASIEWDGKNFSILDKQSITGTYLNDSLIDKAVILKDQDRICIGKHLFTLSIVGDELTLWQEEAFPAPSDIQNLALNKNFIAIFALLFLFGILVPSGVCWSAREYFWQPGALHNFHTGYDCKSCHTPFRGVESEKCSQCHERESQDSIHPYAVTALDCVLCHTEHKRGDLDKDFLVQKEGWCEQCHKNPHKNPLSMKLQKKEEKISSFLTGFNHKIHLEKEKDLSCVDCHEADSTKKQGFRNVSYETCLFCHEDRKVKNHSTGTMCLQCHEGYEKNIFLPLPKKESHENKIRKITLSGSHEMAKEECSQCHKGKEIPLPIKQVSRFSHFQHLPEKPGAKDCLSCHSSVLDMGNNMRWDGSDVCKKCHGDIVIEFQEVKANQLPFSHKSHLEGMKAKARNNILYRQECFACHTMKDKDFSFLPQEDVCKKCHLNHQNYGNSYQALSNCNYCHNGIFKSSFHQGKKKERMYDSFSHSQSPHKSMDCESCHRQKESSSSQAWISLDLQTCQKCHDSKEEKNQKCIYCHGYHSFFSQKKSP